MPIHQQQSEYFILNKIWSMYWSNYWISCLDHLVITWWYPISKESHVYLIKYAKIVCRVTFYNLVFNFKSETMYNNVYYTRLLAFQSNMSKEAIGLHYNSERFYKEMVLSFPFAVIVCHIIMLVLFPLKVQWYTNIHTQSVRLTMPAHIVISRLDCSSGKVYCR